MLGNQIIDAKTKDNKRDSDNSCNPEVEHKMVINWTPPDEKKFLLKRRFVSSRMFSKSVPRRNKSLFQYRMSRSLNFDVINSGNNTWRKSPNFDSSSDGSIDKSSSRDLSRSAKIMRALSLDHNSIRHQNINIKKSLNFDSPSPKKSSYFNGSPNNDSVSVDTSASPIFDKLLSYDTNSLGSVSSNVLIVSSDLIDENQNQTPQKSRKVAKISNGTSDTKENHNNSSESSTSSLLRSNLKDRIDNILHIVQTPDLQSFKRQRSKTHSCVASTPRNLFQEFNQDECDRPLTPENIMHLIPESMSAIKKSHKKEKLFRQEKDIQQLNISVIDNEDLYIKTRAGLLGLDNIIASGSCNMTSTKKSQTNKRNFKKTLIYDSDDELFDKSISDHSAQWSEAITRENNSSGNGSSDAKINKIQDINLSDHEKCEKSIQNNDNIHFANNEGKKENHFDKKDCDKEVRSPISQRESLNTHNISNTNIMVSSASSPLVSQNSRAVTPENYINIMQEIFTESIKKSHKKVKHENRKSFISRSLHQKMKLAQDAHDNSDYENITNTTYPLNLQDSARPKTPDNINSSRLLLMQFNSVKKSHKKDKHNKRISGLAKCHKYQEYRKRNDNSILNNSSKEDIDENLLTRDSFESFELKNSPDVSPNKKKKSMNVSVQNEGYRWFSESPLSPGNIKDEFKIYTPIKRISNLFVASDNVCIDESSSDKSESVQVMPKKVDFSRCITPTAHCSRKSRESEQRAVSDEYVHAGKSKTDACISHDEIVNTAHPKDCIDISHNGRTTPTNMSTTELLCDINSIKKSHKKNKYSSSVCKRGRRESSHNPEIKNVNFANDTFEATFEEHATSVLQHSDTCDPSIETEMCSNIHDGKEDENYEGTIYDTPQPSTSRTNNDIGNLMNVNTSNLLNATPPNDFNTTNFITLFNSTSIKKFHKKERDYNAETKYILMSSEHDLSDDGSIFDKEDRLNISGNIDSCQDSENEMCT